MTACRRSCRRSCARPRRRGRPLPRAAQQDIYDNAYGSVAENFPGAATFELPREEQAKWASAMPNIAKEWAERIDAPGLPGTEVLSAYMNEMRSAGAEPVRNWDQE